MLRRLAFGFAGLAATAITIAGCASGGATQSITVGPTFASQSLYATNSSQNGISIYPVGAASGSGPSYQIATGGSANGLDGPQYIAFDSMSNLFVTNWDSSLRAGSVVELKASATGNVVPFNQLPYNSVHPRGIAYYPYPLPTGSPSSIDAMAVAVVDPSQPLNFSSQIQILTTGLLSLENLGGPNTGLNVPSGIAVDSKRNIYVANLQGGNVEVFSLPSPTPAPSPTATPTPTPTPTPTASGASPSPTPTPTPVPTASPVNIAPVATISGGSTTGIGQPTGIALDASGNVYVSDQASQICAPACPAVLIFPPLTSGAYGSAPLRFIAGSATKLFAPTDVKVDGKGNIYVADSTSSGAGVIYVFAAGASGNVAPSSTLTSPGNVIGLGLTP